MCDYPRDFAILHVSTSTEIEKKKKNPFRALARVAFIIYMSLCEMKYISEEEIVSLCQCLHVTCARK